jgi:hypothetical protein
MKMEEILYWASIAIFRFPNKFRYRTLQLGPSENVSTSLWYQGDKELDSDVLAASPSKCKFPLWLTASQHWHTLDYRRSYTFHKHNTTLRITNMTAQPGTNQQTGSGSTAQGYVICTAQFVVQLMFKIFSISLSLTRTNVSDTTMTMG